MSQDLEEEQEEGNEDEVDEDEEVVEEDSDESYVDEVVAEPFDPVSLHEEVSRVNQTAEKTTRADLAESMTSIRRFVDKEELTTADKTIRTDFAKVGSTNLNPAESTMTSRRFVDKEELDRISAELEERRLNRSSNSIGSQSRRPRSPASSVRRDRRATVEDKEEHERLSHRSKHPTSSTILKVVFFRLLFNLSRKHPMCPTILKVVPSDYCST